MKDLWKSGVLILLIIGVLYILYLRECKRPFPCPPKGQVLLSQQAWDSIKALANKPPTVRVDTIRIKGDVVYVPATPLPQPKPEVKDSTINSYVDSLVNDSIDVHYNFKVHGTLLSRAWRFSPIIFEIRVDSIIYVPNIVEVEKPVIKAVNSLYGNVVFGGNKNTFIFGGGIDFITKKETMIGYQYQRLGNENFHSVILGGRLRFGKK
jgi:hypothetical protein